MSNFREKHAISLQSYEGIVREWRSAFFFKVFLWHHHEWWKSVTQIYFILSAKNHVLLSSMMTNQKRPMSPYLDLSWGSLRLRRSFLCIVVVFVVLDNMVYVFLLLRIYAIRFYSFPFPFYKSRNKLLRLYNLVHFASFFHLYVGVSYQSIYSICLHWPVIRNNSLYDVSIIYHADTNPVFILINFRSIFSLAYG